MNLTDDIIERVLASGLPKEKKDELIAIYQGTKLPQLTGDTVAKRMFSPDEHPDRYGFLMRRIMRDDTLEVDGSMRNELLLTSINAKKIISDIPARFKDGRIGDMEFQVAAQAFIDTRVDIYSSNMLMIQYSVESGQSHGEVDYTNVKDAVIVVFMRNSPELFSKIKSPKYIHRVSGYVADSGLKIDSPRKIAYVQLDKALKAFLKGGYCQDGDKELLAWLAMIADVNDAKVAKKAIGYKELAILREDLYKFSQGKEEQAMILADQLAEMDYRTAILEGQKKGHEEGRKEGRKEYKTDLVAAIKELKSGKSPKELKAMNMPEDAILTACEVLSIPFA